MSIIDKNSVLILGAGVSKPFGIPLGGDLIDEIAKSLREERALLGIDGIIHSSYNFEARLRAAALHTRNFSATPMYGAMAARYYKNGALENGDAEKINADLEAMGDILRLLSNQTSESIDDFIVENPTYAPLTKLCVAAKLFTLCHSNDDATCSPNALDGRRVGPKQERNWIHLLINIIRNGIRVGKVSKGKKIQIVTFNYDAILEYVLDAQFSNTESNYGNWAEYIDITHVHGKFGTLAHNERTPALIVQKWADGMFVVDEKDEHIPDLVRQDREKALRAIKQANRIYAVGFSFAPTNCRLIGLTSISTRSDDAYAPSINYCNYDGNAGVRLNAEKLRRANVRTEETPGSPERPISVSDWLKGGYAGDLPG